MTLGQSSFRLLLAGFLLMSAGCAARSGRTRMASSLQPGSSYPRAQLLAAARQYEKEGRPELAKRFYHQVLALDPNDAEARNGLGYVESGQPRTETNYQEIIATVKPRSAEPSRNVDVQLAEEPILNERTAQMIANAAATAEVVRPVTSRPVTPPLQRAESTLRLREVVAAVPQETSPARTASISQTASESTSDEPELNVVNLEVITVVPDDHLTVEGRTPSVKEESSETPADWNENSPWHAPSLARLCEDANAAVLREVTKLDNEDANLRLEGLSSLAQLGPDGASATLAIRTLLYDEQEELVRAYGAWALWEITQDAPSSAPLLTELLASDDGQVVQFAAYTLSTVGESATGAIPPLQELTRSNDLLIRLHAAEALARIAPASELDEAMNQIIMLTAVSDPAVRSLALTALGRVVRIPTPLVTTTLISSLHDEDPNVRSAAALALGGFGPAASSAIGDLEFVASSDQASVQESAVAALECIRRPK